MKKCIVFSISLLCILQYAWSQHAPDSTWKVDFHVNPLALIYSPSPRLQAGLEYHNMRRLSYGVEFGYGDATIYEINSSPYLSKGYYFYEIRPAIKYFGGSPTQMTRAYIGAEFFYTFKKNISKEGYYYSEDLPLMVRYDQAEKETWRAGANLIFGIKILSITHISIDVYGGFGFAAQHASYYNMVDPEISSIFPRDFWFNNAEQFPGTIYNRSFTGGIKLGFYVDGKK